MFPWGRYRCLFILNVGALLLLAFGATGRLRALDAASMQAMVIVEGDEGRGSGFVVRMDGKTFLVTNSHVVRGNRNVKFKNLRNATLPTGALQIADQVDAVRAEVTGVLSPLELETQIEQVKIGDEVIVAGNSEGEGVIREIPGKVVGIGPDRIEVDAEFVPGNSGSPILLKSTGKVIGVATYLKVPRGGRTGTKSPFSLNEVRRFGYRLDTVTKWITPSTRDRLLLEGIKLAEMEDLMSSIAGVVGSNAAFVTKWGASSFVKKDQARQYPAFAALSLAIDDFVKQQTAAKGDDEKAKNTTAFFASLKNLVSDDVRGLKENQFSGFYAVQLKESLSRCQDFFDWCDGTALPAYREVWLASQMDSRFAIVNRSNTPAIDPKKLNLALSDRIVANEPPDYCHHVGYSPDARPANLENLFWIIENPQGEHRTIAMHNTNVHVRTPISGTYRVYAEYRTTDLTRTVSNTVEVKFTGPAAGVADNAPPAGAPSVVTTAADKAKPLAEFLAGTQWLWDGRPNQVLEFHKDGKVYFADWARQNLVTGWEATGPNQVTLTILSGRSNNRTATLAFSEDRISFTGNDFDSNHTISRSPRFGAAPAAPDQ